MAASKRGRPGASGRAHATPVKHRRRIAPDVAANTLPGDADAAAPVMAPVIEGETLRKVAPLDGSVDDWAGMDAVADMVDEPAEGCR